MKLDDFIVEVRDINLVRLGTIRGTNVRLKIAPLSNAVGSWELSLPASHPMVPALRTPGSGIIVSTVDDVLISGPTMRPEVNVSNDDIAGTLTFTGVCDNIVLADKLCYPQPSNDDLASQSSDYDARTGIAQTLIRAYVSDNVGPTAPASRRNQFLTIGPDAQLGGSISKSARFDNLHDFTAAIATTAGLRQRVVQRGAGLVYETTPVRDLTGLIRLDTRNSTLASYKLAVDAPTATHAIVGSQDVALDRVFTLVTTSDSLAASDAWGRRIETFVNQSYTSDTNEFTQSARELLADQGHSTTSVQAVANDDTTMRFGKDWTLGDKVTVVAADLEYTSIVTGLVLQADSDGVKIGAVLGDVTTFSVPKTVAKGLASVSARVSALETKGSSATSGGTSAPRSTTFTISVASTTWTLTHNFGQRDVFVTCFDSNGDEIVGDVDPTASTSNVAVVRWYYATSGSARVQT